MLFNFFFYELVFLLLQHQLFDKHFAFVFLIFEVIHQLTVLLAQHLVLVFHFARNIFNKLKMVSQFVFTLFFFGSLVPRLRLFLLYVFLCLGNQTLIFARQLRKLLLRKLLQLVIIAVNVVFQVTLKHANSIQIGLSCVLFVPVSDSEFTFE